MKNLKSLFKRSRTDKINPKCAIELLSCLLPSSNCIAGQSLARHYISGALFRSHWVVGSLDLIGSPSGFTRTVGEGVKDFVALPYQGIFQGPWSFFSGLTNGSSSLVKHISAGMNILKRALVAIFEFFGSVALNDLGTPLS